MVKCPFGAIGIRRMVVMNSYTCCFLNAVSLNADDLLTRVLLGGEVGEPAAG